MNKEVEVQNKLLLTLEEAAQFTGIGINKLRSITNDPHCEFVVWNGSKRMIKRSKLEKFIMTAYSI